MRVETSSHVRTVTPRFCGVMGCALHLVQISKAGGVCFRLTVSFSGESLDGGGIAAVAGG